MNAIHAASAYVVPMLDSPFESAYGKDPVKWTEDDRNFLEQNEKIIESGRQVFLKVGVALGEIHDYKGGILYLENHCTFKDYCKNRWGFSAQHVYRNIAAAKVVNLLSPRGDIPQELLSQLTERHTRELNRIQDENGRAKLLKEVSAKTGGKMPSARELAREVDCVMEKPLVATATTGGEPTAIRDNPDLTPDSEPTDEDATGKAVFLVVRDDTADAALVLDQPSIINTPLILEEYMQAALDEIDDREHLSSKQRKITRQFVEKLAIKLNEVAGDEPDEDLRTSAGLALECLREMVEIG